MITGASAGVGAWVTDSTAGDDAPAVGADSARAEVGTDIDERVVFDPALRVGIAAPAPPRTWLPLSALSPAGVDALTPVRPRTERRDPAETLVDGDELPAALDPDAPAEPVVSAKASGTAAVAEPIPRATASAPTRPT
jgi:hypothetical protein